LAQVRTIKEIKTETKKWSKLFKKAQMGNVRTLNYFTQEFHCKIYTQEEINVLNNYLKKKDESKVIMIRDQNRIIDLPDLRGDLHAARINWIMDLGDGYFRAGLSYICGYPYDGGSAEWVLKLDEKVGFKPLFDSACWEDTLNSKPKEE